jgi:hypothetical protein
MISMKDDVGGKRIASQLVDAMSTHEEHCRDNTGFQEANLDRFSCYFKCDAVLTL